MHELSIAQSVIDIAVEHARAHHAVRVQSLTLRIGALSCVHKSSLEFCFDLVAKGTVLEGAELRYIDVPVAVFCTLCQREVELLGIQRFRCPICDTACGDVRRGKELELDTIECVLEDDVEVAQ